MYSDHMETCHLNIAMKGMDHVEARKAIEKADKIGLERLGHVQHVDFRVKRFGTWCSSVWSSRILPFIRSRKCQFYHSYHICITDLLYHKKITRIANAHPQILRTLIPTLEHRYGEDV